MCARARGKVTEIPKNGREICTAKEQSQKGKENLTEVTNSRSHITSLPKVSVPKGTRNLPSFITRLKEQKRVEETV